MLTWPQVLLTRAWISAGKLTCGAVAGIAMLFGFLWQCTTVAVNYHGEFTALYCIGSAAPLPPKLKTAYRFQSSTGFDGQFYLLIAMDPLFRRGTGAYVDEPDLRYRRILLPALAYALGFGYPGAIIYTYLLVNLGFLFLGTFWMSKQATLFSRHPAWGWLFLAVPAVLISLDRQTVDMALTALSIGTGYAWRTKQWKMLFVLLPLVCLVRETGLLIVGAFLLVFLFQRHWQHAAFTLIGMVPFLGWSWCVGSHFPLTVREWIPTNAYAWTIHALLHPKQLPFSRGIRTLVECFDVLALIGFLLGCILSAWLCIRERGKMPAILSSILFAGLGIYLFSLNDWMHVYDYGRIASPMAACLLAERSSAGWLHLAPSFLMTSRVVVQLVPQALHAIGISL